MSSILTPYGLDKHVHESRFLLRRTCKLTGAGLIYACVLGVTGCATSAELESLRAEVTKVNATVVSNEAEMSRTQQELATLKAAAKPPEIFSKRRKPPAASMTKPGGYKWGKFPQDQNSHMY